MSRTIDGVRWRRGAGPVMAALWLLAAPDARAVTHELRWVHAEPDRPVLVFVIADGESVAELPVDPPDADGVFTTLVPVPSGAAVQIQVQDAAGRTSEPSNVQVYGDDCHEWDSDGDGVISMEDVAWFRREFADGTASMREFGLLKRMYGRVCAPEG